MSSRTSLIFSSPMSSVISIVAIPDWLRFWFSVTIYHGRMLRILKFFYHSTKEKEIDNHNK
jgi:hypothetical protein